MKLLKTPAQKEETLFLYCNRTQESIDLKNRFIKQHYKVIFIISGSNKPIVKYHNNYISGYNHILLNFF